KAPAKKLPLIDTLFQVLKQHTVLLAQSKQRVKSMGCLLVFPLPRKYGVPLHHWWHLLLIHTLFLLGMKQLALLSIARQLLEVFVLKIISYPQFFHLSFHKNPICPHSPITYAHSVDKLCPSC